jgi:hypothetical protein
MTSSRQPGVTRLDVLFFFCASCLLLGSSWTAQISGRPDDMRRQVEPDLATQNIMSNINNFYNYSIVCGGREFDSRVNMPNIDPSIPAQFKEIIQATYTDPAFRLNKCPKWSTNEDPNAGAMEKLVIEENTPVGTKVFSLLATDPEMQPVHYFIRNVESEPADASIIFRLTPIKVGNNYIGEVSVDGEIDYEKKKSYQYLTYAFDGVNLIERYTSIQVTDVDDEAPVIVAEGNARFDAATSRFEYSVYENISIGEIVNRDALINFVDVDTQRSQLKVRLENSVGSDTLPFAINNEGEIKLITNLDYEVKREYTFKLIIEVS